MKGMLTGPGDHPAMVLRARRSVPRSARLPADRAGDPRRGGSTWRRPASQMIQIDEAALREGLPLRKSEWQHYLDWAVECFRICSSGVARRHADPHAYVLLGVQRHHRRDRRDGRRRDLDRDLALEDGAAGRLQELQIPQRDRPRRLRHPFAARARGRRNDRSCSSSRVSGLPTSSSGSIPIAV